MVVLTLTAVFGAVSGVLAWFNSLPPTFKYIIFLSGLTADAGLTSMVGFEQGLLGSLFTGIISQGFQIQGFVITSWQLLVVFTIMPFAFFLLKNSMAHQ
ncbi:MAG: hypothetical protein KAU95_02860 [Candidatus Aenigmarchaeota archaeon]|nr:hypothetical protein [Candidatus Aenigmarchaeota archaeon]